MQTEQCVYFSCVLTVRRDGSILNKDESSTNGKVRTAPEYVCFMSVQCGKGVQAFLSGNIVLPKSIAHGQPKMSAKHDFLYRCTTPAGHFRRRPPPPPPALPLAEPQGSTETLGR